MKKITIEKIKELIVEDMLKYKEKKDYTSMVVLAEIITKIEQYEICKKTT